VLTLSFAYYAYAVAESLNPRAGLIRRLWSVWLPLLVALLIILVRWCVLTKFDQEDRPFRMWWRMLTKA
jgi:hypothetical protein